MPFLVNSELDPVRVLSTSECNGVAAGSYSSDPLIIMAGIIGAGIFVFGFLPFALI